MKFEEKEVTTYGNSKVINVSNFSKGETVYILDKEMLEYMRGLRILKNIENGK